MVLQQVLKLQHPLPLITFLTPLKDLISFLERHTSRSHYKILHLGHHLESLKMETCMNLHRTHTSFDILSNIYPLALLVKLLLPR